MTDKNPDWKQELVDKAINKYMGERDFPEMLIYEEIANLVEEHFKEDRAYWVNYWDKIWSKKVAQLQAEKREMVLIDYLFPEQFDKHGNKRVSEAIKLHREQELQAILAKMDDWFQKNGLPTSVVRWKDLKKSLGDR